MVIPMSRFLSLSCSPAPLCAADAPFVPLFDGKTLNGWEVCNGSAKYTVEDGVIVGTTAKGSPNSFLCTQKDYGDFVLEFDVKTDPALNTGVQIRSHRYPEERTVTVFNGKQTVQRKQPKDRVHGYQVEIGNEAGAQERRHLRRSAPRLGVHAAARIARRQSLPRQPVEPLQSRPPAAIPSRPG